MNISTANRGRSLETVILASQRDVALVKMPHAMKFLPGGKTCRVAAPVDFFGLFRDSGRMIVFDAKQSKEPNRFPVRRMLRPHQRAELIRLGQAGAVAGMLVESTAERFFYWMDWTDLRKDVASVRWDHLYPIVNNLVTIDFALVLTAALAAGKEA